MVSAGVGAVVADADDHKVRTVKKPAGASRLSSAASMVGQWNVGLPGGRPFELPTHAIHSVVMPNGKVLFWSASPYNARVTQSKHQGTAAVWDPGRGSGPDAFTSVPPPLTEFYGSPTRAWVPAPIECSGQSLLPDGRVLVTGGDLRSVNQQRGFAKRVGLNRVYTFDPWSEQWTEQPQMHHGRWYPSQTLLGNGQTLLLGGYTEQEPGAIMNPDLEVFSAGTGSAQGTIVHARSGDRYKHHGPSRLPTLYPRMFQAPSGRVFLLGPGQFNGASLKPSRLKSPHLRRGAAWKPVLTGPSRTGLGGNAIQLPGGPNGARRIMQIGGIPFMKFPADGGHDEGHAVRRKARSAVRTAEIIDLSDRRPQWKTVPGWNVPRTYANTVLLPDGSMVTIGGGWGIAGIDQLYAVNPDGSSENSKRRHVELYDPRTNRWRLGPAQVEDRAYHSTAVLLPDGRVLSAGDDLHMKQADGRPNGLDTGEIYSPPYLFKGPRPQIASAPGEIGYRTRFSVDSPDTGHLRAVLMAPNATTHGTEMAQRLIRLKAVSQAPGAGLQVEAPSSTRIAAPGWYMLFLLNERNVPSTAAWVHLGT